MIIMYSVLAVSFGLLLGASCVVETSEQGVEGRALVQPEEVSLATQDVQSLALGREAPDAETIYWRCPGRPTNYSTRTLCQASCSASCFPVLVCTDNQGRPILCP